MTIKELRALSALLNETADGHAGRAQDARIRRDLPYAANQKILADRFRKGARDLNQLADAFTTLTPLVTSRK